MIVRPNRTATLLTCCMCLIAFIAGGCVNSKAEGDHEQVGQIPSPVSILLPHKVDFHPFTEAGIRQFDEAGGVKGIETRIRLFDKQGHTTKGFGQFRVELFDYRPDALDHKGQKGPTWEIDLMDPGVNNTHWDEISRAYKFLLQWDNAIPVGQKYVLRVSFSSPWTPRLFAEEVYIAGQ